MHNLSQPFPNRSQPFPGDRSATFPEPFPNPLGIVPRSSRLNLSHPSPPYGGKERFGQTQLDPPGTNNDHHHQHPHIIPGTFPTTTAGIRRG